MGNCNSISGSTSQGFIQDFSVGGGGTFFFYCWGNHVADRP